MASFTFTTPGGPYALALPAEGCALATVSLVGGGGGGQLGAGGAGAAVTVSFPALPGEALSAFVGGGGLCLGENVPGREWWWGGGGGGASALTSGRGILAVAGGGGGAATDGSGSHAGMVGANGGDAGLPSADELYDSTGASPWLEGDCIEEWCGERDLEGDGGKPDWLGASRGGAGGEGYSYDRVAGSAPGFGLGGKPGFESFATGSGGGSGGGGLFGGAGGSDRYVPAYPGTGGSSFSAVLGAAGLESRMASARNGGAAWTSGGNGSVAVSCSGEQPAPAAAFSSRLAGVFTWIPPAEGCPGGIQATLSGGGGGGGLGGGGAGALVSAIVSLPAGAPVRVWVGAGGAGAADELGGGSGGGASAVWSGGAALLVAAGGGGGATDGGPAGAAAPCAGGAGGTPDGRGPVCAGSAVRQASGGTIAGAGAAAAAAAGVAFGGHDGAGPHGGPGYAWTGQLPQAAGFGLGGPGGRDAGNSAAASGALSPRARRGSAHNVSAPGLYGGGGGGGGGLWGGGGGGQAVLGARGTPGAGGASFAYLPALAQMASAANGGAPFSRGGDGSVSLLCLGSGGGGGGAAAAAYDGVSPPAAVAAAALVPLLVLLLGLLAAARLCRGALRGAAEALEARVGGGDGAASGGEGAKLLLSAREAAQRLSLPATARR